MQYTARISYIEAENVVNKVEVKKSMAVRPLALQEQYHET